jgi:hypothetical protein
MNQPIFNQPVRAFLGLLAVVVLLMNQIVSGAPQTAGGPGHMLPRIDFALALGLDKARATLLNEILEDSMEDPMFFCKPLNRFLLDRRVC